MEDQLRKIILGKYYKGCKSRQIPISNLFLAKRLQDLKNNGMLVNCQLEDIIQACEFKPLTNCVPKTLPNINQDLISLEYQSLLQDLSLDDIDTSDEPSECPICLEEFDEEKRPIERLSHCGHYIHHSCIYNTSKAMGQPPFCPICKTMVTNVTPPSQADILEGKRELALQYQRGLAGRISSETNKEDLFKRFVLSKVGLTEPFINVSKLVSLWNIANPTNPILPSEEDEFKEIARFAYKERFSTRFDPDVDEMEEITLDKIFILMKDNILDKLPLYKQISIGPLEIQDLWNHYSVYTIDLNKALPLYEALNEYRVVQEKKYKVQKSFDQLYEKLLKFDEEASTDISTRVKIKYEKLRQKEDKDEVYPGSYVQKEIFDKPFDKLVKKDGCVIN